jgi:predicted DNA-binding protein
MCYSVAVKGEKLHAVNVRVTPQMKARVVALARERGESEGVVVREAIRLYLAEREGKGIASVPVRRAGSLSAIN